MRFPDYTPRSYQQEFEDALLKHGKRRAFLLYHRRAGKDFACWMFMLYCALRDIPGVYWYLFPNYAQGKKVIWDGIDRQGKKFLDYIPKPLYLSDPNKQEMKITLSNGSIIQIIGVEKPDSIRGPELKGVVLSEYAYQNPLGWESVVSQMIRSSKGWAIFNTTPNGRNHAYDLWNMACHARDWYTKKLTVDDTGLVTKEEIDKERAEGRSEEIIQQEYYCSFTRGVEGSYYARFIEKMREQNRICKVPYEVGSNVYTAWDIGHSDSTSIIFWQRIGLEDRIIDFYENQGEYLDHYVRVLQSKPYTYETHFVPHDAKQERMQGPSVYKQMVEKRLPLHVLDKSNIEPGIECARRLLNSCYIDEVNCRHLIKCLENYHKQYNDKKNCYSDAPVHDWSSNAADAFRYMALARDYTGGGASMASQVKAINQYFGG